MTRFVRTVGLSIAAVLGAVSWASAQTTSAQTNGREVTYYPNSRTAPTPAAPTKGIETLYPRPPGSRSSGIETAYAPRPSPHRVTYRRSLPLPLPRPRAS